jgi:23S rRNA pseudouridine1911/1915/1917 synthase
VKREVRLPLTVTGRLDRALADALGLGRAAVKAAFAAGEVRIRGKRVKGSEAALPGALVELDVEGPAGAPLPQPELSLRVLRESERWLVVDKPAGVATHPLLAEEGGTLANAVVARHPECAQSSAEPREGGAVHRLDVETSGCVLFARDEEAWQLLRQGFASQAVEKGYLALVAGRVEAGGVCSVPLAQRGGRSVPARPEDPAGKRGRPRPAETHYEPERALERHTLLRVRIVTGVMHQIRAHLSMLGHPVVGDLLYGGAAAALPGLERHFLHASRLGFEPPEGGERVVVESPLPAELVRVVERLTGS